MVVVVVAVCVSHTNGAGTNFPSGCGRAGTHIAGLPNNLLACQTHCRFESHGGWELPGSDVAGATDQAANRASLQDVAEDASLLARLVHQLRAPGGDTDAQYEILQAAQVGGGGLRGWRGGRCALVNAWLGYQLHLAWLADHCTLMCVVESCIQIYQL